MLSGDVLTLGHSGTSTRLRLLGETGASISVNSVSLCSDGTYVLESSSAAYLSSNSPSSATWLTA